MRSIFSKIFEIFGYEPSRKIKYGVLTYLSIDEKALMMQKGIREGDPNSGYFAPPGGKLEDWEKGLDNSQGRLEAAIREPQQESGLIIQHPTFRGVILFDNKGRIFNNWKNPDDFLVYVYSSSQYVGELSKGKDNEKPVWVNVKDIPSLPKNPGDVKMYEWLKDGRYFFGVIKHKGKELDEENTQVDYL